MQEEDILKQIIQKGAGLEASPELEAAIMQRISSMAEQKPATSTLNLRVPGLFAGLVGLAVCLLMLLGQMPEVSFQLEALWPLQAISLQQINTLALCLLGFWLLLFLNYLLNNRLAGK